MGGRVGGREGGRAGEEGIGTDYWSSFAEAPLKRRVCLLHKKIV